MAEVDIVVVGAGVVGLSAAIELQEAGYKTAVVAEIFPNDPKSPRYTSFWAGGHHNTFSGLSDTWHHDLHKRTFIRFRQMFEENPDIPLMDLKDATYLLTDASAGADKDLVDGYKDIFSYEEVQQDELPSGAKYGISIQTHGFDAPNYMLYLLKKYAKAGGLGAHVLLDDFSSLVDGDVTFRRVVGLPLVSVEQVRRAKVFVNATGLFAKDIGGIEDHDVYPVRGQTVLVRAPWIKESFKFANPDTDRFLTYVIPRRSGDVVIGGTFGINETHPEPDPELARDILERALDLYPALVPVEMRENPSKPQIGDLDIVSHSVGFRPSRKGGIRIDAETFRTPNRTITLIHDYGHGGTGFQTSWGSAERVLSLVESLKR